MKEEQSAESGSFLGLLWPAGGNSCRCSHGLLGTQQPSRERPGPFWNRKFILASLDERLGRPTRKHRRESFSSSEIG